MRVESSTSVMPADVRIRRPDSGAAALRLLPVEAPISLEYNGLAYGIMMATPIDLEDFAVGFSLSEGVVAAAEDIVDIDVTEVEIGWIVRIQITTDRIAAIHARIRTRVSDGGCGLCGIENLEQAMRPPPHAGRAPNVIRPESIFKALAGLRRQQPLNAETGAVHAAAMCAASGDILVVREDVGRHNAFDKLIGALARAAIDPAEGFALLTSRCSYELVDKALVAGFTTLTTISAPTSLALSRATKYGLTLVSLARPDAFLVMHDPAKRLD